MTDLVCWKCGAPLAGEPLPLGREARCKGCGADLHCCMLCAHHEPKWTRGCREPRAEEPRTRDGANFCDWFKPRPGAFAGGASAEAQARAELDALFGRK